MAYDDQDDLFVDDFDFVDDDEEDSVDEKGAEQEQADSDTEELETEAPTPPKRKTASRGGKRGPKPKAEPEAIDEVKDEEAKDKAEPKDTAEEKADAPAEEPPGPPTDHVVHVYECREYKRTINREFTSDDAEAFVVEYNRTSSAHSRQGVAASKDDKPAPTL